MQAGTLAVRTGLTVREAQDHDPLVADVNRIVQIVVPGMPAPTAAVEELKTATRKR